MAALLQCRFPISVSRRHAAPWCVDVCAWSCSDITLRRTRYSNRQLLSSMKIPDQASRATRHIGRSVRRTHASAEPPEHTFAVMLKGLAGPQVDSVDSGTGVHEVTDATATIHQNSRAELESDRSGRGCPCSPRIADPGVNPVVVRRGRVRSGSQGRHEGVNGIPVDSRQRMGTS